MTDQDDDFARIIAVYIAAGMPATHGLTEDEYVETCRRLWDACETDTRHPFKVLIDRSYYETTDLGRLGFAEYVDPRARAALDVEQPPPDPIYCSAVGLIPLVELARGQPRADQSATPMTGGLDKETSERVDFDLFIVAVFDVLGFEGMYRSLGPHRLREDYEKLVAAAQSSTATTAMGMSFANEASPTLFHFDLGFAYFSDTIVLWAPLTRNHVSPFLARCADVLIEALKLSFPLRGAVAVGEAILDPSQGVFVGSPLIEAVRLEHDQDWLGVALGHSCSGILEWIDSSLVLPYTPPCKPPTKPPGNVLHAGFALDWPRRARERSAVDAAAAIHKMDVSSAHHKYYRNALRFLEFSARIRRWNRDDRLPIALGFVRRAALGARLDGVGLSDEAEAVLRSLESNGPEGAITARCLRALIRGEPLSSESEALPQGPRGFLEDLADVLVGNTVDVEEMALAALEAREGIHPLTRRQKEALEAVPTERNEVWRLCIPFLHAVVEGEPLPAVPAGLPQPIARVLENARSAALNAAAPVDLETLLMGVLWANTQGTTLSRDNRRRLERLLKAGPAWEGVGLFLEKVAAGGDADANVAKYDPAATGTVRVVHQVMAWQSATRRSPAVALAQLRGESPLNVGTLLALLDALQTRALSPEHESMAVVASLETLGSPHDAVARFVRELAADEKPREIPGGISEDVRQFLMLAQVTATREPMIISSDYLVRASLEARQLRRPPTPYERAIYAYVGASGTDNNALVKYLEHIAAGEPPPPVPRRISNTVRAQLSALRGALLSDARQCSLNEVAIAALQARRSRKRLAAGYTRFLVETRQVDGPEAAIASFIKQMAGTGPIPTVPLGLPDRLSHFLSELRMLAYCSRDAVDFEALAAAAVDTRVHGTAPEPIDAQLMEGLLESGAPYAGVATFLKNLAEPGAYPELPAGIPLEVLTLLASARREAFELERTMIAVARRPTDPGTGAEPA